MVNNGALPFSGGGNTSTFFKMKKIAVYGEQK
jgi:hypothetical protein